MSKADANWEVVWNDRIGKWEVCEKIGADMYAGIDSYDTKAPAKKFAKKMASKQRLTYAAYSKDAENPRVTERKDYRDY